jgi:hypothetical protein
MNEFVTLEEVKQGYSPKPVSRFPSMEDPSPSDSNDPDTQSPNGKLEGPDLTAGKPSLPDDSDFSIRDGIITFAK